MKLSERELTKLGEFFSVFSDPTRLKIILLLLKEKEACCVNRIAKTLNLNQPAVSQQMRVLRNAGLVKAVRTGKFVRYSITDPHVEKIIRVGINHINGGKS